MLDPDSDRTGNYRTGNYRTGSYRTTTAHTLDTATVRTLDTTSARALDTPTVRTLDTATETPLFRYADLAVALIDEATAPRHHRTLLAVGYWRGVSFTSQTR